MKKFVGMMIFLGLILTALLSGCGGGGKSGPTETVIFSDDFDSITGAQWNLSNTPADNRNNWETTSGAGVFDVDTIGGAQGKVLLYNSGSHMILNGNASLTDYTITANVRQTAVEPQGIVGRYKDADEFYALCLGDGDAADPTSRKISLFGYLSGVFTRLQDASVTIQPSTYYTLKMIFSGTNIKGYLNGVKYIDYTNAALVPNGRFGIRAMSTSMYFADFKVTQP